MTQAEAARWLSVAGFILGVDTTASVLAQRLEDGGPELLSLQAAVTGARWRRFALDPTAQLYGIEARTRYAARQLCLFARRLAHAIAPTTSTPPHRGIAPRSS